MDPLITKVISIGFGILLLSAAHHKLAGRAEFVAVLGDYQVLPPVLVATAAWIIMGSEVLLGFAWFLAGSVATIAVASATTLLMTAYTLAIGVNLLRGRVYISCGCGLSTSRVGGQQLSWGLVLRNTVLIIAALAAARPVSTRMLGLADYATLIAALIVSILLYVAGAQLLQNSAAIGTWRNARD